MSEAGGYLIDALDRITLERDDAWKALREVRTEMQRLLRQKDTLRGREVPIPRAAAHWTIRKIDAALAAEDA